jgi:hypothetical protein
MDNEEGIGDEHESIMTILRKHHYEDRLAYLNRLQD